MEGNRQHQRAEGTKQEMEQNEVNARQNKERAAKEKEIQDEEEKIQAQAEAERRTLKYIREQNVKDRKDNREVLDDKLKGDMNRITSSGQLESERNRTQLATSLLGSKSGIDRMRAMGDYRANEEYNQQNTALQRRQKLEMEALLDKGGSESEKMALEDKHAAQNFENLLSFLFARQFCKFYNTAQVVCWKVSTLFPGGRQSRKIQWGKNKIRYRDLGGPEVTKRPTGWCRHKEPREINCRIHEENTDKKWLNSCTFKTNRRLFGSSG